MLFAFWGMTIRKYSNGQSIVDSVLLDGRVDVFFKHLEQGKTQKHKQRKMNEEEKRSRHW